MAGGYVKQNTLIESEIFTRSKILFLFPFLSGPHWCLCIRATLTKPNKIAVENGTYWAAARFLEAERVHPNRINPSVVLLPQPPLTTSPPPTTKSTNPIPQLKKQTESKKRKSLSSLSTAGTSRNGRVPSSPTPLPQVADPKRCKKFHREEAIQYMKSIMMMTVDDAPSATTTIDNFGNLFEHRTHMIQQVRCCVGSYPLFFYF